jgi:peptidoglycan-N-acetylmuramic acid deacetylase
MKKFFVLIILLCIASQSLTVAAADRSGSFSWYCVHCADNRQPVCDPSMNFIERYGGYYIDKRHGDNCKSKVVYLTFDAGYENGNVAKILDTLKEENVKGAFFVLSNLIEKNTDLVKRMVEEGHTVCNHTSKHRDMSRVVNITDFAAELESLEKLYYEKFGRNMAKYYRPPEGKFSEANLKMANELGYKTIFWSFAYADWDNNHQMSEAAATKKILSNIHNGAILLLHPTSKTNAAILGNVIRTLKNEGYRFGSLDELTAR